MLTHFQFQLVQLNKRISYLCILKETTQPGLVLGMSSYLVLKHCQKSLILLQEKDCHWQKKTIKKMTVLILQV